MVFIFYLKIKSPEYWDFWRALKSFCFYRKQVRLFPKTPWITGTLRDIRLRRLCSHGSRKRHQVASPLMGWELRVGEISLHLTFRGNTGWLHADQLCGQAEEMLMAVSVIILAILIFRINWKPRIKVTFLRWIKFKWDFPEIISEVIPDIFSPRMYLGVLLDTPVVNIPVQGCDNEKWYHSFGVYLNSY